jgi:hypothetical protein
MDAGQGIPTLLEALNDKRARIAIYALRRALLVMPQTEALKILREAPRTQVTVAKEVVRLIGELSSEAAYQELLALDAQALHRDVRVALLRAFWPYVERAETWEVFTRAAQSPDTAIVQGVIEIPADGISSIASKRLAVLLAMLLSYPDAEVRVAVLQRCKQHLLTDDDHVLFPPLLAAMRSALPDECKLAADVVFTMYTGKDATLVGEVVRGLLNNRRALHITMSRFLSALGTRRRRLLPTTRAILAALARDRLTVALRVSVIIAGLPWDEVAPELMSMAHELHPDALHKVDFALYAMTGSHVYQRSNKEETILAYACRRSEFDLLAFEMALATSKDERLRRLALSALVAQAAQADGWTDERIVRLEAYRQDPSVLVAEAAQFTFPS